MLLVVALFGAKTRSLSELLAGWSPSRARNLVRSLSRSRANQMELDKPRRRSAPIVCGGGRLAFVVLFTALGLRVCSLRRGGGRSLACSLASDHRPPSQIDRSGAREWTYRALFLGLCVTRTLS